MLTALDNPDDGNNRHNIETAFGQNYDIARIRDNVSRMQAGTMHVPSVTGTDPYVIAAAVPKYNSDGTPQVVDGRTKYNYMRFGATFFAPGNTVDDRAGTLIHEASHYLAGTKDHVLHEQQADGSNLHQIDQPGHTMENPAIIEGMGCK